MDVLQSQHAFWYGQKRKSSVLLDCRQESYFHYLFGVTEDSFYGAIDLRSGEAYLFMPRMPESFAVWFGEIPTPASVKATYAVQVHSTSPACRLCLQ